jgi:nitrate reductase delta subunit
MHVDFSVLPGFADLLEYPNEHTAAKSAALADRLQLHSAIWQDLLEAFALHVSLTPQGELEETYTRIFDMNPSATLEIGWHLFGETYKRGSFLANLREANRTHGVDEGNSLPDFLPTLLRLAPKLERASAQGLVADCMLPALAKIRPKVDEGSAPYQLILESLELLLKDLVPLEAATAEAGCGCGSGHGTCNGTEVKDA